MGCAFAIAQQRGRTTQPSPELEIADGNRYTLAQNTATQTFTVTAKLGDRDMAHFDLQGTVLSASPALHDRRQWQQIAEQV